MNYLTKNSINNFSGANETLFLEDIMMIVAKITDRDISDNTKKAIALDLKRFIEWYVSENNEPLTFSRLTERDIIDYKRFCQDVRALSPKTINRRLASIKLLCKLALKAGYLEQDPSGEVKQLPLQPLHPRGLPKKELRALIKEVELRRVCRDKIIMELLYGAGLRASEVVNIQLLDVHISERNGFVVIRNSKGGRTRNVPLNKTLRNSLSDYLPLRQKAGADYLFSGQRQKANSTRHLHTPLAINKIVEVYAKKAGIKCSPHMLRHTFAFNYLHDNPGDIVGLSQILGHSTIATTAIYTQHRFEDLQDAVDKMSY